VGADRRGPLAAFVIVALIAAILLVTSVRSQAAPWLRSTVVAGPVGEPHLWSSVTGGVDQVVRSGTVLVRKAAGSTSDPTRTEAQGASTHVVASRQEPARSATHEVLGTQQHHRPARRHPSSGAPHGPAHPGADPATADAPTAPVPPPSSEPDQSSPPAGHDHGLHLGWYQHHGQAPEPDETSADPGSTPDPETGAPGNGHEHGHGHAYGHDQRH
jgi:hypothetical protein